MKNAMLYGLTALSIMSGFGPNDGQTLYGFKRDGSVRTDLEYIRHLGMPNLNKNVIKTNHKANPIKKRLRKLQAIARRITYRFAKR